jgi:hypothetical protein
MRYTVTAAQGAKKFKRAREAKILQRYKLACRQGVFIAD